MLWLWVELELETGAKKSVTEMATRTGCLFSDSGVTSPKKDTAYSCEECLDVDASVVSVSHLLSNFFSNLIMPGWTLHSQFQENRSVIVDFSISMIYNSKEIEMR